MKRILLLLFVTIFLCSSGESQSMSGIDVIENNILTFIVTNRKNESGEWVTWFSASKNTTEGTNNVDVTLLRTFQSCSGYNFMNIRGTLRDVRVQEKKSKLRFHRNCSNNAALTNKWRTLQSMNEEGTASAMTNRPLQIDELFMVRFDKRLNKSNIALGIGVTTHSPEKSIPPDHVNTLKPGTWMLYHNNAYHNSIMVSPNMMKISLDQIKIGQTIGVMKNIYGTLHYFVDGVNQGPVASKIPDTVYGVFEVFKDATQGTIVYQV